MRFKTDWVSLIARNKFTVFALFYFVFESNFPSTSPQGAYIWRGDLTKRFLRYQFGELIFRGAYFRNFTYLLLAEFSVRTENSGPSFFPSIYGPSAKTISQLK